MSETGTVGVGGRHERERDFNTEKHTGPVHKEPKRARNLEQTKRQHRRDAGADDVRGTATIFHRRPPGQLNCPLKHDPIRGSNILRPWMIHQSNTCRKVCWHHNTWEEHKRPFAHTEV